jgi:hypothetical protein
VQTQVLLDSSFPGVGWGHNNFFYILKIIGFSTLKLYIFLFLVSRGIRWYAGHDHTWWSRSPLNRKCPNITKTVEITTLNHLYSCFLFQVATDGTWYVSHDHTWWSRFPLEQEVSYYPKNRWDPHPKPYIFLFVLSSSIWWYVGYDHMEWSSPP